MPAVRRADTIIVWGGDVLYLRHWMQESGLATLLPELENAVYLGIRAGSIVVTPFNDDADVDRRFVPDGSDRGRDAEHALGLVDIALFPHLDNADMPEASLDEIRRWSQGIPVPTYAIDDDTALRIVGHAVEVVSEGSWSLFTP